MKLYAIAFILAVFCVANLHARQIEISSDNHGFTINFEIKKVYFNQSDTSAHIEINGHYAGSVAISQELDISALKLIFAAPPGGVDMQSEFFDLESLVIPDGAKAAIAESGHDRPSAEYTYKGRQRGVESYELTIYPYSLSKGHFGWMRRGSVRVEFSLPDNLSAGELPAGEQAFFGHFINPGHIPALLEKYSLSKKRPDRPMNKTGWYDPETEYVRVTTTRDGVAKIDVAEILGIKPGWNGMPSDRLNMLFLGADYPVYINDSDGTLGIGDEIYFYGRRAFGDTTWNANYTREAVFYLFMGESAGLRAELLPDPGPGAGKIESVRELMHIEQDNIYNKGKYFTLTETLTAEGWYWDELSSISNESLTHLQYLVPAGGENDEYHIGMTYQSMNDTLFPQDQPIVLPQNHLRMFINGVMKAEEEFICIQRGTIGATLPSSQMRSGLNKIVIESMPAEPGRNSVQSVDYFEIEGNFRPFAYKNEASFSISPVAADAAVEVHGFSHASVVAYDLANHRIAFPKVAEGLSYTLNSVAGDSSAMTIRLDDSLYYSQKKGLHIAIKRSSGNSEYRLFEDISNENEILSFVQSATTGDYLAFALNSDKRITGKTAERIAGLGSGAIYSVRGGEAWSYIARKTGDQTYEYINESHNAANANIAGFMHMEGGASVSASIAVPAGSEMRLVINDGKSIEQASISNVETSDLASGNNPAEAIIVSHPDFMTYAEMLANHRSSQGITTVAINVENIYKEFGYGWKSPHAIKDFLAMAYNEWSDPRPAYLILFGDASWDPRKNGEYSIATDFVPTYGNPTSDYWYGFIDESDGEYNSELIIGRIPVTNDFEAAGYIAKVLEYDSIPARPWMKNFLLMTGGTASDHSDEYYYTLNWNYYEFILNPELCADTTEIRKSDQLATGEANAIEIIDAINSGAIWVNFLGHGSPWVIEMGGWQPEKLNNKGRYPILTTQSCNTGAYGEPSIIHSINEGYVVIPEKGMIAAMGMTFTGSVGAEVELFVKMFRSMVRPNMRYRRVGDAMNYAKSLLGVSGAYLNYRYQYSLLGDPLTTIRIEKQPELFLHEPDISITDQSGETVFNDSDEKLIINAVVHNNGVYQESEVPVILIRRYGQSADTLSATIQGVCLKSDILFELPIKDMTGKHTIELIIDPDEEIDDADRSDNKYITTIEVFRPGLLELDPQPYWPVATSDPRFRVINPLGKNSDYEYEFRIIDSRNSIIAESAEDEIEVNENYIEWQSTAVLAEGQNYTFNARFFDPASGTNSEWLSLPVYAGEIGETVKWRISGIDYLSSQQMSGLEPDLRDEQEVIGLEEHTMDYKVIAVGGWGDPPIRRWSNIEAGGVVITDGEFHRGFNVVVIPFDIDAEALTYRHFDTYGAAEDTLLEASRNFVNFVRDSVPDEAYVLMGTCDISFRQFMEQVPWVYPNGGHPGHIDTVKQMLHKFGARSIDTVQFGTSYALFSWRGADSTEARESINLGDTARLDGTLIRYKSQGQMVTNPAGPARSWASASISGLLDSENSVARISIMGIRKGGAISDTLIKYSNAEKETIRNIDFDLSEIDAQKYPFIYIIIELNRINPEGHSYISEIGIDYIPAAEFALVKSEMKLKDHSILRGEQNEVTAAVQNIMYRIATEPNRITLNFTNPSDENDKRYIGIGSLAPDEMLSEDYEFITTDMDATTYIDITADEDYTSNELYRFNNHERYTLDIFQDREKPTFDYTVDGREIEDGDYVTRQPEIVVDLYDNSPLAVENSDNLKLRINGYFQDSTNTDFYHFESFGFGKGHKARLRIVPRPLDYGDHKSNYMIIYARDATGNADTLQIYMNVSRNGMITELKNSPNPFSDGTKYTFGYRAPENEGRVVVRVYNLSGEIVRTLSKELIIGENEIWWSGYGDDGRTLPIGVYFYRVDVEGGAFVEPVFGKLLIVR